MSTVLRIHPLHLALRTPLVTAAGTIASRRIWLVEASDGTHSGWGEAAPLPGFGGEPPEWCERTLMRAAQEPDEAAWMLAVRGSPCAQVAVEGAVADLAARARGEPLSTAGTRVALNALAGSDAEAIAAHDAGAPVVKLKSCGDPVADAARVRSLHARRPEIHLRLDANASWDFEGASAFAHLAAGLVDYVEQPLPASELEASAHLRRLGLRVALDEGVRTPDELARALATSACDTVVLKPNWFGGLSTACGLIALAQGRVGIVLSGAIGSAVERMHAAHLAAVFALPGPHGLATGHLLERDVAELPLDGPYAIRIPELPGLGIAVRV